MQLSFGLPGFDPSNSKSFVFKRRMRDHTGEISELRKRMCEEKATTGGIKIEKRSNTNKG